MGFKVEEKFRIILVMKEVNLTNVLCMSSGTCTNFQITDTDYVPLLIHGVMCRFYSRI